MEAIIKKRGGGIMMEEIYQFIENNQLINRKKIGNFFEKYLQFWNYDYSHDRFKKILYGEESCETRFEEKMKNYLDGFVFLLSNYVNSLTKELLKKFFYLIFSFEYEEVTLLKLSSAYFFLSEMDPIEKALEFHIIVYEQLADVEEFDRMLISFIMLNFILVKNNIPCVCFFADDLNHYKAYKEAYLKGQKEKLWYWLFLVIKKNGTNEKTSVQSLKPLVLSTIYDYIVNRKDYFITEFHIKHLWVYGSYAKGIARFDSDVDILVRLSMDLTADEQEQIVIGLKQEFKKAFLRSIDIHLIYDIIPEGIIKTTKKIKKII